MAVFGHMGQAQFPGTGGVQPGSRLKALAIHAQAARLGGRQPREHVQQLALPVARHPGHAHDFTRPQLQAHACEAWHAPGIGQVQVLGTEPDVTR